MSATTRWMAALVASTALFVSACGGDDGGSAESAETTDSEEQDATEAEAASGDAGDCDSMDAVGESPDGSFTATSGAAVSLEDGAAWTIYLADFDLAEGDVGGFSTPDVPADGTLFTVAVTIFNAEGELEPIPAGTTIDYTPDFGVLTFRVTADVGGEVFGNNAGASGTVTLTAVGERVCGEIRYEDDEKSLTGTFEADAG